MKQRLVLLLISLFSSYAFSQGEANNWYFGVNAGVTFNTTPPSALTNGQLETSEGCSSISDSSGNLLFYTDGRTVWNRNHEVMANADYDNGTGLLGDPSSTSSGLIVPHPTDPNLYYIFTVDEPHHDNANAFPNRGPANENGRPIAEYSDTGDTVPSGDDGFNNGFNYSLVDISLDNGLGDVVTTEKNIQLQTFDSSDAEAVKYKSSEKITAVRGADCNSFWVITHFIDSFYAFRIDSSGVNTTPMVSTVGPTLPTSSYRRAALGYMKASPDGTKVAIAHHTYTYMQSQGSQSTQDGTINLYDFNNLTGEITNDIELLSNVNPYSVEFSPDSSRLFASVRSFSQSSSLFQWDLTVSDITRSRRAISGLDPRESVALQLAPNGKIYLAGLGRSILRVLNNPNGLGNAVDYSESTQNGAISLSGGRSTLGLPPFIQSIFNTRIDIVNTSNEISTNLQLCDGETFTLEYNDIATATYSWFKNDVLLTNETEHTLDISQTAGASLPSTDEYMLEVDLNNGDCPLVGVAVVTYSPFPVAIDSQLVQCQDDTQPNGISPFNLTEATAMITSQNPSVTVNFYEDRALTMRIDEANYTNTRNNQEVFAEVVNPTTTCSRVATLTLIVQNRNANNTELNTCGNPEGFGTFTLSNAESAILSGLDPNLQVAFYKTESQAFLEEQPLPDTYDNEEAFTEVIYARVEDSNNECFGISEVQLNVNTPPKLAPDQTLIYCLEDSPQPIQIISGVFSNPDDFTYQWMPSGDTTASIMTAELTTHTVTVTNRDTGCSSSRSITIEASDIAQVTDVEVSDLSNTNTLTVIISQGNQGDYEYALDNPNGPYQDSPEFTGVAAGLYNIFVRDKNGCGISQPFEVGVLGFMEFFTPNNDGFNDTWRVIGASQDREANAIITIFDRFGKLIKTFIAGNGSWDGTLNGNPLPSSDYWFRATLEDGRVFSSNFTLKR